MASRPAQGVISAQGHGWRQRIALLFANLVGATSGNE
jgi:hypothetical protein